MVELKTKLVGLDVLGVSCIASGIGVIDSNVLYGLGFVVSGVLCIILKQNFHLSE